MFYENLQQNLNNIVNIFCFAEIIEIKDIYLQEKNDKEKTKKTS